MPRSPMVVDSRRKFLRQGAATVVLSHPLLAALARRAPSAGVTTATITLKPAAQYMADGAEFDAAVRSLSGVLTTNVTTDAGIAYLNTTVAAAVTRFDLHHSWLVASCLADPPLMTVVSRHAGNAVRLRELLDSIIANRPSDAETRVKGRMEEMNAQIRATAERIAILQESIAKLEQVKEAIERLMPKVMQQMAADVACQQTWAIVTSVLAGAALVNASLGQTVTAIANELSARYAGTGADRVAKEFQAANQRYQLCISAVAALPPAQRAKAVAACQAQWIRDKSAYFG